ncbi:hypothetical protein [Pseudoponticoccus marisrubri]|nr:hypothetical protein [Pseudoponticoccus marisrubri]
MKTLTLIQAGILLLLAVVGAYASNGETAADCRTTPHAQICEL